MSIGSDTAYIKMPLSTSDEVKIDACIAFKFNIDHIMERNGHASARTLLSYSTQDGKKAINYLSYGDCVFDCLGFSDSERLELAVRARTNNEYIICKTKYGASVLITKLIAAQGIALLLIPDKVTSISLRRVFCKDDSISYAKLCDLASSNGGAVFGAASKFLSLVEKSIMCDTSANKKKSFKLKMFESVYAIAELFEIHPTFLTPVAQSLNTSPSLFTSLTYLFSIAAARLSSDGRLGIRMINKGKQSIINFSIRFNTTDNAKQILHRSEIQALMDFMNEFDIMESYAITKDTDADTSILGISAQLCVNDPSMIGLKHPKPKLYSELTDNSDENFFGTT